MHTIDAVDTHLHFIHRNLMFALQCTDGVERMNHIVRAIHMCEYLCLDNKEHCVPRVVVRSVPRAVEQSVPRAVEQSVPCVLPDGQTQDAWVSSLLT